MVMPLNPKLAGVRLYLGPVGSATLSFPWTNTIAVAAVVLNGIAVILLTLKID